LGVALCTYVEQPAGSSTSTSEVFLDPVEIPARGHQVEFGCLRCCTTGYLLFTRIYTDFSYAAMMLPTRLLLDRGPTVALTGLHLATNRRTKAGRARTRDADRA
jgi:hypothetical protein